MTRREEVRPRTATPSGHHAPLAPRNAQPRKARPRPRSVLELGTLIRNRREEYELPAATLARHLGWDRQRLDNLERGIAVSGDVRAWVRLADRLGFTREFLLGAAWDLSRQPFPLRLPPVGDPKREELLHLLISQHAQDLERY